MKPSATVHFEISEKILIAAGVALGFGILLVFFTGSFSLWVTAKMLYVLGVAFFLFNK